MSDRKGNYPFPPSAPPPVHYDDNPSYIPNRPPPPSYAESQMPNLNYSHASAQAPMSNTTGQFFNANYNNSGASTFNSGYPKMNNGYGHMGAMPINQQQVLNAQIPMGNYTNPGQYGSQPQQTTKTSQPHQVIEFNSGARFNSRGHGTVVVPPPPPGCPPTAAQLAALQGQPVIITKKKSSFF